MMVQFLILATAALLRVWGIDFGLPHLYHADEPIIVNHALAFGSGDFNPHFFNIPPFTSYLLFGIYGVLFLLGKMSGFWFSANQFADLFFHDPSLFYLTGRMLLGVLPAVLTVFQLMCWSKEQRGESRAAASLTGALMAVCFIHVSDAHYIYTDMLLVFFIVVFFRFLHLSDLAKIKNHCVLGLIIGIAAAIKYNGVFLAVPYLWLALSGGVRPVSFRNLVVAALCSVMAFLLLNPFAVTDFATFARELHEQSSANSGVPFLHHLTYSLAEGMGYSVLLLSFAGMIRSFLMKDIKTQSVAVFCLVYFFVLWQKGQPFGRYVLPLVPALIYLAAYFSGFALHQGKVIRCCVIGLLVFSLTGNFAKSVLFDRVMAHTDIRTESKSWIEKQLPENSGIALDGAFFSPRLNFSCDQLVGKITSVAADSAAVKRLRAKYDVCKQARGYRLFFISKNPGTNPFLFANPEIALNRETFIRQKVRFLVFVPELHDKSERADEMLKRSKLVQVWDPRPLQSDKTEIYDSQIITGGPFTWKDLLARNANGYRIELYDLGEAAGR